MVKKNSGGGPGARLLSKVVEDPKAFNIGKGLDGSKKDGGPSDNAKKDWPVRKFPAGFKDQAEFDKFQAKMFQHLRGAGYNDVKPVIQGSSATGYSRHKDKLFGPDSDYDIGLAGNSIYDKATKQLLMKDGADGFTPALTDREIKDLGLKGMHKDLEKLSNGHEVNFMVFNDTKAAWDKSKTSINAYDPPRNW